MKNYVSEGKCVPVIADAPVRSSVPLIVGSLFGIPATSAEKGQEFELYVVGVYELRKDQSTFKPGDRVYFNPELQKDPNSADGDGFALVTAKTGPKVPLIGVAAGFARETDSVIRVRLNGVSLE